MTDFSITIPKRDYKLIKQAVKKHRYPVEDPSVVGRNFTAESGRSTVNVTLKNNGGKFYLLWLLVSGTSVIEKIVHDMNMVSFGGRANAHFDIDPGYD